MNRRAKKNLPIDTVLLILVPALLLLVAALLRLRGLDTTAIWADQSFTLGTAMRWINGGRMPLAANKSSIGVINPPMIEYLYALALRLWPDVLSVALLTLISGLVAIAAAGWAVYRTFGRRAALWTVLLFAVNPWSVYYSQLIWNQTMVPVFSSLMFASLLVYFAVEQRPIYLILSFLWAACMTQVHPGTVIQLVTMAVICALFWRKLHIWGLVGGAALFLALYTPFLLYESAVGWADVRAALELSDRSASWSSAALLVSLDWVRVRGLLDRFPGVTAFDALAGVLLIGSILYGLWRLGRALERRHRTRRAGGTPQSEDTRSLTAMAILLLWFGLPILFYLRFPHYLQVYYLVGQVPAHFVLMGLCLAGLQEGLGRLAGDRIHRVIRMGGQIGLLMVLAAWITWQAVATLEIQDRRSVNVPGKTQVRHVRSAIQTGRDLMAKAPSCSLVLISKGHSEATSDLSLVGQFVSPGRTLVTDGTAALPLPAPCGIYVDAAPGSRASSWLRAEGVAMPNSAIQVPGQTWLFYKLTVDNWQQMVHGAETGTPIARWSNGIALRRYRRGALQPGGGLPITLTWTVEGPVSDELYHFGSYLLTSENGVVAQTD
jgi:hypothetical protein